MQVQPLLGTICSTLATHHFGPQSPSCEKGVKHPHHRFENTNRES